MIKEFLILAILFSASWSFGQYPIPYKKGNLFGYSNSNKEIVIEPIFEKATMFNKKGFAIVTRQNKQMLIDKNGKLVNSISGLNQYDGAFDQISPSYGGHYVYKVDGYVGVFDSTFNGLLHERGDHISSHKGWKYFEIIKKENAIRKHELVDKKGNILLSSATGDIGVFKLKKRGGNDIFYREKDNYYIPYNNKFKPILDTIYTRFNFILLESDEVILCYQDDGVMDVYDKNFKLLIRGFNSNAYNSSSEFDKIHKSSIQSKKLLASIFDVQKHIDCWYATTSDHCLCVNTEKGQGEKKIYKDGVSLLDSGEIFLSFRPTLDLVFFKKGEEVGMRNLEKKDVIPLGQIDVAYNSRSQNLFVQDKEGFKCFNRNGNEIKGINYRIGKPYSLVDLTTQKLSLQNGNGIPLTEFNYDAILSIPQKDYFFAKENNFYHLLDTLGNSVKILKFDQITRLRSGIFKVSKNDKTGIISGLGEVILPTQYSDVSLFSSGVSDLYIVKRDDGSQSLINSKNKILQIEVAEVKTAHNSSLIYGYNMLRCIDGKARFFSDEGKEIMILPKGGVLILEPRNGKHGILRIGDFYINYTKGHVYKE